MLHNGTTQLFDYWNAVKGNRTAPLRSEIAPAAISSILPSTFILHQDDTGQMVFRLAGTALCLLFSEELKGKPFDHLLDQDDRNLMRRTLSSLQTEMVAVVLQLDGTSERGRSVQIEALLLPMMDEEPRILGCLHTMDMPYWIGAEALMSLTISNLRIIDAGKELISLHNRPAVALSQRKAAPQPFQSSSKFAVLQGGAMLGAKQAPRVATRLQKPNLVILPGGRS
ncbi:PAS domain-containing protein [Ahrensia sp. 13_GOM-1096m]|uniref:PAS domain-containing protein n=1 Tax=Ahrensia sp. 13_GOM-1096m TaxID=1380380 RepID=UPI000687CBEB|nr:PAS domain-containing protein [Ahrensia sp. 13_GOM-1096m]